MKIEYKIIDVKGYNRKMVIKGEEVIRWINPYKRKLKIEIDDEQKTIQDFEMKK